MTTHDTATRRTSPSTMQRAAAFLVLVIAATTLTGCAGSDPKQYDIGPIFPLSADKCAKYHGTESGEGITQSCMVTKAECKKAAGDWLDAMRSGGVDDAMLFSCD